MTRILPPLATVALVAGMLACASNGVTAPPTPVGVIRESVSLPARPYGLAVAGSSVFVTQLDGATVTLVDLSEAAAVRTQFTVGSIPTGAAATRDGALLLVANQGDASLSLIDVATGAATLFRTSGSPYRALISRDGRRAYATTGTGGVVSIDLIARRVLGTLTLGGGLNGLALSPDDTLLYVTDVSGSYTIINVASFRVVATYYLYGQPQDVVVAPDGTELYIADEAGRVVVVSQIGAADSSVPVPGAFGMALSLDGTQLWVTQPMVGAITVIDRRTRAVIKTIPIRTDGGRALPRRIAFTEGGLAVVTDEAGSVHILR
jgi:DNA-binding beta-propeller fold protein YncE